MLVAFPVTFYTSTWIAFALYAATESVFWWQVGLGSNLAGVLTTLLLAVPGSLGRLLAPSSVQGGLKELRRVRLELCAFGLFALNLLAHHDRWAVAPDVAQPLISGEVQVVFLPDAWLPLVLSGVGLLLTLLAGFLSWALLQTPPTEEAPVAVEPRLELRPSRNSLVPT